MREKSTDRKSKIKPGKVIQDHDSRLQLEEKNKPEDIRRFP